MSVKNLLLKNLSYAFVAQISAIVVSLMFSIGITKIFNIEEYGYWQLFVLYSSYIGLLHLGICDGLYLKLGGRSLKSLNLKNTSNQFQFFFLFQLVISILFLGLSYILLVDQIKSILFIYLSIFILITNVQTYLSYILLATNEIKAYSLSVLTEKMLIICLVSIMMCYIKITVFDLVKIYLISRLLSVLYLIFRLRSNLFYFKSFDRINYRIFKIYSLNGILLMFSNICSTLILGCTRFFIEDKFGIIVFSKISFSLSLVFLFIVIISQLGLIMFPILRNLRRDKLIEIFVPLGTFLNMFFIVSMIGFYPLKWFVEHFLHKYNESLYSLMIILPICLFEGKVQILFNTYFKVLREQKTLFVINFCSLIASLILSFFSVYVFNEITIVLYVMLVSVFVRYLLCELYLMKLLKIKVQVLLFFPIAMSFAFIFLNYLFPENAPFLFLALIFSYFLILYGYKEFGFFNKLYKSE